MSNEEQQEAAPSFIPAQQAWIEQLVAEKVALIAPLTSTTHQKAHGSPISNAGGVGKSQDSIIPRIVKTQQSGMMVSVQVHDVFIRLQS